MGSITSIENAGSITANGDAVFSANGSIEKLLNNAGGQITGGTSGIYNSDEIGTIDNRGTISSTQSSAIKNDAGIIGDIENSGFITGSTLSGSSGIVNDNGGLIKILNNAERGQITGTASGISNTASSKITTLTNAGLITTFTNYQGGGSTVPQQTALTYAGQLPGSYFIHITSTTYCGQLVFTNPTGSMTFDVDPGSSIVKTTYYSVLSHVTDPLIVGARSGVLNRLRWYLELHRDASGATSTDVWDLVFKDPPPPSSATTLEALSTNATDLRNAMTARSGAITETMDYDCATFDAYGACLSFKARSTVSGDQSEGAGVLIAAYRLWPQVRAGAFIDYRLTPQGATGLTFSVERPIFGAFAGYDQEGEGRGLQGKLTAAVNTSRVSITRRSTLYDAEPGSGKASLNTYGAAGEVGWGFALEGAATATPYAGLRYTYVIRGAYGESLVPGVVDYPISYEAYSQRLLTATGGMRLKGQLSDQVGYQLGLGGEFDLTHRASPYAGSSAVPGLESFALPFAAASNHFHALGSAGLVYQIDRTQRLTGDVYLRSQAFSSQTAAAVVVGYQAAF